MNNGGSTSSAGSLSWVAARDTVLCDAPQGSDTLGYWVHLMQANGTPDSYRYHWVQGGVRGVSCPIFTNDGHISMASQRHQAERDLSVRKFVIWGRR